ncbi:MAG: AAA family ATPase [Clostridia bacterium]|nr:AAA family ATPase [Clostridia bacterium]NCC84910.1 AAA family ATPase [Clostridia bacterium]
MAEALQVMDADTLLSTPMEKTMFVVERLVPQGLNLLCGSSKIGKSWLMLWLCLQVSQGLPVWDCPTRKCDVLYLCLEDTFTRIQSRLFELTDAAPQNLRFAVMCGQIGSGLKEQIEDYLNQYPETKLIVIDTLQKVRDSRITGRAGMYAGDYDDASALKRIADESAISIVLVHHLRKQEDEGDPFNQVSGSTGITGAVDSTYILKKASRASDTATLLATGRDIEFQQLKLRFEQQRWHLIERLDAGEIRKKEVPPFLFQLAEFMKNRGSFRGTATQLLHEMGCTDVPPNTVSKLITRYYDDALTPEKIVCTTKRTATDRLISLYRYDGCDDNDGNSYIPEKPSQPS